MWLIYHVNFLYRLEDVFSDKVTVHMYKLIATTYVFVYNNSPYKCVHIKANPMKFWRYVKSINHQTWSSALQRDDGKLAVMVPILLHKLLNEYFCSVFTRENLESTYVVILSLPSKTFDTPLQIYIYNIYIYTYK